MNWYKIAQNDYSGEHEAPDRSNGAPLHNLNGIYPDDIYTSDAVRLYSAGESYDSSSIGIIQSARNRPNLRVTIYRSVPYIPTSQERINDLENQKKYILRNGKVPSSVSTRLDSSQYFGWLCDELDKLRLQSEDVQSKRAINTGDWVTISRQYAVDHGKSSLKNQYKVISKTVRAKDIYTTGDSIHEWGYDP
jgi:hypothetical protein